MQLQPQALHVKSFRVAGFPARTKNADEFNPSTAKLGPLWAKFRTHELAQADQTFGVYSHYESDVNGYYTLTAGIKIKDTVSLPEFKTVTVQEGKYLVFENKGPMPQAIIATWQQVWQYFQAHPEINRSYHTDFEVYTGLQECAIYIGIKE